MKLSPREILLLMLVLAAACCVGFYNYVYTPMTTAIAAGEADLARLEMEHNRLLGWQAEVPQTEQRMVEIEEELEGWVQEAKAIQDVPQVLLFVEAKGAEYNIDVSSVRISVRQATLSFTAPDYLVTRQFLQDMERMMALEVSRARYNVPTGTTVDGSFDVQLHIGAADPSVGEEPTDRINPFRQ